MKKSISSRLHGLKLNKVIHGKKKLKNTQKNEGNVGKVETHAYSQMLQSHAYSLFLLQIPQLKSFPSSLDSLFKKSLSKTSRNPITSEVFLITTFS